VTATNRKARFSQAHNSQAQGQRPAQYPKLGLIRWKKTWDRVVALTARVQSFDAEMEAGEEDFAGSGRINREGGCTAWNLGNLWWPFGAAKTPMRRAERGGRVCSLHGPTRRAARPPRLGGRGADHPRAATIRTDSIPNRLFSRSTMGSRLLTPAVLPDQSSLLIGAPFGGRRGPRIGGKNAASGRSSSPTYKGPSPAIWPLAHCLSSKTR
jgi:hypothetical protein